MLRHATPKGRETKVKLRPTNLLNKFRTATHVNCSWPDLHGQACEGDAERSDQVSGVCIILEEHMTLKKQSLYR